MTGGADNALPLMGLNITTLLVLMGGVAPNCWYWWDEYHPIVGIGGWNSTLLLVLGGGIATHY